MLMTDDAINLKLVLIIAVGFGFASILGYLADRMKLSPIVGYLLAGYLIGPYSPGFIADLPLAEQLAEIGVILMMFGVGMHFKWQNLWRTSRLTIPGAIVQTLLTTLLGAAFTYSMGWHVEPSLICGLAIGVASTVILIRVLTDNHILNTSEGHICVGWLIVEDIITVFALLLIPALAGSYNGDSFSLLGVVTAFGMTLATFLLLALVMLTIGDKLFSFILDKVTLTHSHELFTLTSLAITFGVAVGSALLLGTSMVLGAFLAGMVMGQTRMHRKVAANATPIKDTFLVIFFLSIGMLFNPSAVVEHFVIFIGVLALIMILKPLIAFAITLAYKYPMKTAVTVGLGMAQIGEFSFILCEEATKFKILPDEAFDIIVACSLVSISINPMLFRFLNQEKAVKRTR